MKFFIAIVFSAVVVSAIPQGWGPPPPVPAIDLGLAGTVFLSAEGSASAGQEVLESASGNAEILSFDGVNAGIAQNGDVIQIANADLTAPAAYTIQGASGSNAAVATDYLGAELVGDNNVAVSNSASSVAEGEGVVVAAAVSENFIATKKN